MSVYGYCGCGCSPMFSEARYPIRGERLRWLEEYQRDLEQRVADVADEVKRLKEETGRA